VSAFEQPENRGKGVLQIDGRMYELLHAEIAKRTVAVADAIKEREAAQ
jgi:citrate lyase subunit beta/citryl-CoA lyase